MEEKKEFRHHPDGYIYINGVEVRLDEFTKDNPEYRLPDGWIGREYVQGEFNRVYDGRNEEFLDVEWKEGDEYLKQYDKYKKIEEKLKIEDIETKMVEAK